jgi:uncharacterized protein YbaR (Trm112 family)
MKPRTKLQHEVVKSASYLPPITNNQRVWAFDKCLDHVAYQNKSRTACLDCGHIWEPQGKKKVCVCPSCKKKLKITNTRKLKLSQETYFAIITTQNGFQVNRYYELNSYHRVGEQAKRYVSEVCQQWLLPNGKYEIYSRLHKVNWYQDTFYGDFAIRAKNPPQYWKQDLYNLNPAFVYPEMDVLPEYRRNGFTGNFGGIAPLDLFQNILSDNRAETLLKVKQYDILKSYICNQKGEINGFWGSIRICVRNNYYVKDARMWFDYLNLLWLFGKDLLSPKYVCPADLKAEHDKLVVKKRARDEREEAERKRRKALENEKLYKEAKEKFFDLAFKSKELEIRPLKSVSEFMEEGDKLHHCVFTNEYFLKKDSLILSARIEDKPIETIEVNLSKMKVVQSRGLQNGDSPYHKRIVSIVSRNMNKIRERMTS